MMSGQGKSRFQTAVTSGAIDREDIFTLGMPPFFILSCAFPYNACLKDRLEAARP